MQPIKLLGTLFSTRIDKEGESKITFCVPQSHLLMAMQTAACTEQLLNITIEVDPQGVQLNDPSAD